MELSSLICFATLLFTGLSLPYAANACDPLCTVACDASNNCTSCPSGYALTNSNPVTCQACAHDNCISCDVNGPGKCDVCSSGYGLNDSFQCQQCVPNCQACDTSGPSTCDTCDNGYSTTSGTCTGCSPNCVDCTVNGPTYCDTCYTNYYLNNATFYCQANSTNPGPSAASTIQIPTTMKILVISVFLIIRL